MMVDLDGDVIDAHPETTESNEVVRSFKLELTSGLHWYLALLNAVGRWELTEETIDDRVWHYLIAEEAFDFMVLAERLCDAINSYIPPKEKEEFLFKNTIPIEITQDELKDRIGEIKYHQYLNFYYGITVEEALHYAVEEEIRKERRNSGLYRYKNVSNEVFQRIYLHSHTVMLKDFRKEKGYSQLKSIKMNELKEFTYWLFKYRLKQSDKARVASDTKKGLDWIKNLNADNRESKQYQPENIEVIDILKF